MDFCTTLLISTIASAIGGLVAGVVSGKIIITWQRKQALLDKDLEHIRHIWVALHQYIQYPKSLRSSQDERIFTAIQSNAGLLVCKRHEGLKRKVLAFVAHPGSGGLEKNMANLCKEIREILGLGDGQCVKQTCPQCPEARD